MRRKDLDKSLIREYVTEALLQLLKKKDYDEISVREIAERAGVHRATFYRHFSSKEDVLRSCFVEILKGAEGDRKLLHQDFSAFIRPVFQALYDRREEILLLNRAHLTGLLMDVLKDYFGFEDAPEYDADQDENMDRSSVSMLIEKYRSAYRIGGIYSCLLFWFSHDMKETPEEMARIAASM